MKFITRHPRLTYLLIGFLLGMVMVAVNNKWSNATISEYKSIMTATESRYEELLEKSHTEISSLSRTNETLKQHSRTRSVTLPDGTVTIETDTESDSNTVTELSIRQTIEIEYERKMTVEREKHTEQINTLTNRKLRLGVGYTTDLEYYGRGSYDVIGPISIGGGIILGDKPKFMFDIGISL